ncbi:TetR family transcriptional regulator [Streptomyces albofaciens JCM 4342]|uniref:TetR/AcrR family transcriptional regulator n=1 Tax=Streptomyces albofaciens TaxID=66866 RepID=UPI00123879CC|nr:TetR/AcrR family transcriptional regulator [Streptomyces albofaciens]KAA6222942.1 TetR family transcriptional regulator [Streptomyces albofaciens JCM 4342]
MTGPAPHIEPPAPADSDAPVGRRERKKARTRKALADAALELFLERGFEQVSVKEIADAADVSVTTLFKHFAGKEALVFDLDDDIEAALVAAVRDRAPGRSVPQALCDYVLLTEDQAAQHDFAPFARLVADTPALRDYAHRMWMRHETALARAIAQEAGAPEDDPACAALAHFALESRELAQRYTDRKRAAEEIFALLERGWAAVRPGT